MAITIDPTPVEDKNEEITQILSQLSADELQQKFDTQIADIEDSYQGSLTKINESYDLAVQSYNEGQLDVEQVTEEFRRTTGEQITNIANAYNTQAAREAERVDALVAGGALGGNAYRAFQAKSQVSRDLMGQAVGQIADISLKASESLMDTYATVGSDNQSFAVESMSTIASIAGQQAEAMLGFSSLLASTSTEYEGLMQNLMSIQLSTLSEQNTFALQSAELELRRQQSNQSAGLALMNMPSRMSFYRTTVSSFGDITHENIAGATVR